MGESAAMLVLLGSPYYFKKPNTLRELAAAKERELPLVLVHEADPTKHGAPLCELREVTPPAFRSYVFERDASLRDVSLWHRKSEFQQVCLAQIAEQLLLASPAYATESSLPLSIPGGVAWACPVFVQPVGIYVSPHNSMATHVAQELATHFLERLAVVDQPPEKNWRASISQRVLGRVDTHWLLCLSATCFEEHDLKQQVLDALRTGLKPVMVYQPEECVFAELLAMTPKELLDEGLYGQLAIEWRAGALRKVSIGLLARELGARMGQGWCGRHVLPMLSSKSNASVRTVIGEWYLSRRQSRHLSRDLLKRDGASSASLELQTP